MAVEEIKWKISFEPVAIDNDFILKVSQKRDMKAQIDKTKKTRHPMESD